MELGTIQRRVKAMLATAANKGSSAGEIETAMDMAMKLMEKYNLEREDIEQIDDTKAFDLSKVEFSKVTVVGKSSKGYAWEAGLANFICAFIAGANYYSCSQDAQPLVAKRGGGYKKVKVKIFYGPAEDVQMAAEIYRGLHHMAYTYAMQMYGGWCKGDGGTFCHGFVQGLQDAHEVIEEKQTQTTALVVVDMSKAITVASKGWLKKEHGVKLSSSTLDGVRKRNAGAFANGRTLGSKQSMNTSRRIG
jgi:hypothetical protein